MRQFPLAHYRVREALRVGGLCQTYRAEPLEGTGPRSILLKQLLPLFASQPLVVERWFQKAEENAQLNHPGCVRILDWGWADETAHLALEHVEGVGLKQLLRGLKAAQTSLPVDVSIGIARGALEALAQGHDRFPTLSHLDVSPYSIVVRPDGTQVLTEFGMWAALEPSDAARIRFDRGRSHYLAPELAWSAAGDTRSDVFSCGALLYELLVGERPFQGATQLVIAMAISEGKRKPIREHERGAALPELLCEIVEHMLAHDASNRFQTARAALNALTSAHPLDGSERQKLAELCALAAAESHDAASSRLTSPPPRRPGPKTEFFRARSADGQSPSAVTPVAWAGLDALPRPATEPATALHVGRAHAALGSPALQEQPASGSLSPPPLVAPPPLLAHGSPPPSAGMALVPPPLLPVASSHSAPLVPAMLATAASAVSMAPPRAWIPGVSPAPPPRQPASAVAMAAMPPVQAGVEELVAAPLDRAHLPAVTHDPLPSMPRDEGRWRDPSNTLFQMKNYASSDTQKTGSRMPVTVAVALAVVFGFAAIAGGYLLFRLVS